MNNGRLRFSEDSVSMTSDTYSEPATWQIWTFTHVKADGAWVWYKNGISDNSGTQTYNIPDTIFCIVTCHVYFVTYFLSRVFCDIRDNSNLISSFAKMHLFYSH